MQYSGAATAFAVAAPQKNISVYNPYRFTIRFTLVLRSFVRRTK